MDDDDDFLYGGGAPAPAAATSSTPQPAPQPVTQTKPAAAPLDEDEEADFPFFGAHPEPEPAPAPTPAPAPAPAPSAPQENTPSLPVEATAAGTSVEASQPTARATAEAEAEGEAEEEGEEEEEEESDDDVEFIMEPTARSLDLRPNRQGQQRNNSAVFTPTKTAAPAPSLTTEYTPRDRNGAPAKPPGSSQPPATSTPQPTQPAAAPAATAPAPAEPVDEGPDPSTLPVATAAASHPPIDPAAPALVDSRPVYEVDLSALSDKAWRRPGADLRDWFNYGFDEVSWEAYCFRRRELGAAADVLKANVLTFAGMPEEQIVQLPPDVRQMVMAGTNAMMGSGAMPGNGDMGLEMQGMGGMPMQGMPMQGMQGMNGMGGMGMMPMMGMDGGPPPDAFGPDAFAHAQGMGMPGEFGMADPNGMQNGMQAQMFAGMEPPPAPGATPMNPNVNAGGQSREQGQPPRGGAIPQSQFQRGRGGGGAAPQAPQAPRGAGRSFAGRGRGGPPTAPARAASPLPPNVPTGPRNANKYKDRDNGAPAVDGLDYGGGATERSSRTPTDAHEDRTARKRRERSPTDDRERRDSKRR